METLAYDFNGDGKTDENDKAYKITNAGQLYWFAAYVNEGGENLNANAYLANDITVNANLLSRIQENETTGEITNDGDFRNWVPIGNFDTNFSLQYAGVFDGNNHAVKGIYINETSKCYQGTFGSSSGTIKKLIVEDSIVIDDYCVGGIVSGNKGNILNCTFQGIVYSVHKLESHSDISEAGGICGANAANSRVVGCVNEGKVIGYCQRIGGICGGNINEISECENKGEIINYCTGDTEDYYKGATGGIVGYNGDTKNYRGTIVKSYNYGKIVGEKKGDSVNSVNTGGIVGVNKGGR